MTTSRIARRCSPPGCTATSTPSSTDSRASTVRSPSGSAPDTSNSMQVTGRLASRADPVDVRAAGGDPAGDRGDRRRQQRLPEHA